MPRRICFCQLVSMTILFLTSRELRLWSDLRFGLRQFSVQPRVRPCHFRAVNVPGRDLTLLFKLHVFTGIKTDRSLLFVYLSLFRLRSPGDRHTGRAPSTCPSWRETGDPCLPVSKSCPCVSDRCPFSVPSLLVVIGLIWSLTTDFSRDGSLLRALTTRRSSSDAKAFFLPLVLFSRRRFSNSG